VTDQIEEYRERMRSSPQFARFGLEPLWLPGTKDIAGFVHDEVIRQWHDPRIKSDGGDRIGWMLNAWQYASNHGAPVGRREGVLPDSTDIILLGKQVEPRENLRGFRTGNVYIGNGKGAPPAYVPDLIAELVTVVTNVKPEWELRGPHPDDYRANWGRFSQLVQEITTVTDWYAAYEAVHPFGDGNGRTGKILSNWLAGSLYDPVLVPDLWNSGNP
jgi:hypothetical protein